MSLQPSLTEIKTVTVVISTRTEKSKTLLFAGLMYRTALFSFLWSLNNSTYILDGLSQCSFHFSPPPLAPPFLCFVELVIWDASRGLTLTDELPTQSVRSLYHYFAL